MRKSKQKKSRLSREREAVESMTRKIVIKARMTAMDESAGITNEFVESVASAIGDSVQIEHLLFAIQMVEESGGLLGVNGAVIAKCYAKDKSPTLSQVGAEVGLTGERVRQIKEKFLYSIRLAVAAKQAELRGDVLSISVRDLVISTRTKNALLLGQIETIGAFVSMPERSLLKFSGIGTTSVEEMYRHLDRLGLHLVSELNVGERARGVLLRYGFRYADGLRAVSPTELLALPRSGRKTVEEICLALHEVGIPIRVANAVDEGFVERTRMCIDESGADVERRFEIEAHRQ